jgi:hypothetical protein
MSIVRSAVYDPQGLARIAYAGDLLATNETVPAANSGTAVTLTGALLALGIYLSSAGSAPTLTLDSAANIVASLAPQFGYNQSASLPAGTSTYQAIPAGTSFRLRYIQSTAFAATIQATANTGVTVNRGSVPASTSRDFLITIVNGTPVQSYAVNSTSGSAVLSGFTQAQLSTLSPGMIVTNSALNLQGQTISSINIAAGTITMSGNANATAVGTALTFSPVVVVDGL